MGHYHRIVNLTQRSRIVPMDLGVLDKLVEFGNTSGRAMGALWLLLGSEAWGGDRVAILGYEGRPHDLAPDVTEETGLDGTAFYAPLPDIGELARKMMVDRGICTFSARTYEGTTLWHSTDAAEIAPAGVDVVAANLDRGEVLGPGPVRRQP